MKRNNFFHFLKRFGIFGFFAVDDEDGGGAGGEDNDKFDVGVDDEDGEKGKGKEENSNTVANDERVKELESQIEKLSKTVDDRENERELNNVFDGLASKHDGFKREDITKYLQELHKTDPKKAEELNSPLGFENIYLMEFAPKEVDNDDFDPARNVDPVKRSEELETKIESGEMLSLSEQMEYLR